MKHTIVQLENVETILDKPMPVKCLYFIGVRFTGHVLQKLYSATQDMLHCYLHKAWKSTCFIPFTRAQLLKSLRDPFVKVLIFVSYSMFEVWRVVGLAFFRWTLCWVLTTFGRRKTLFWGQKIILLDWLQRIKQCCWIGSWGLSMSSGNQTSVQTVQPIWLLSIS